MRIFPELGGLKTSTDYLESLTRKLNIQRKNGHEAYCDVTLICNGERLFAHKAILSAASPYFECLLEGQFAESRLDVIDLTESLDSPETLRDILEFIYTGSLVIDGSNFRSLLGAASLFLLNDAIKLLSEYLKGSLVISNCLYIFELAFKYSLDDLSLLCLNMIQARMHDYFRHGSKMLAILPETFIHLCTQDVFTHTRKQDTANVIKEYIENLRASDTEVSKESVSRLYEIAEYYGVADISSLFEGWCEIVEKEENVNEEEDAKEKEKIEEEENIEEGNNEDQEENVDKEENVPEFALKSGNENINEKQSDELLLVKAKRGDEYIDLVGWLSKESKWIKLGSVNLKQLGQSSLGRFVGFANSSIVFEVYSSADRHSPKRKDVILINLNSGKLEQAGTGCDFCLNVTEDDDNEPCPHIYFTAWNELFCLFPSTEVHEPEWRERSTYYGYDHYYGDHSDCDEDDFSERFMLGYEISKYSPTYHNWVPFHSLDIPREYYYHDGTGLYHERPEEEVVYLTFKVVTHDDHLLIAMVNKGGGYGSRERNSDKFLTVMKLTPDGTGNPESEVKYHSKTKEAEFYVRASVAATSGKLTFRETYTRNTNDHHRYRHMTELDLTTGELSKPNLKNQLPQNDFDDERNLKNIKSNTNVKGCATSKQSVLLYYVHMGKPYMPRMKKYDPVNDKWESLPPPPEDKEILGVYMQAIPTEISAELSAYPPVIFEDRHENIKCGPFGEKSTLCHFSTRR